MSMLHRIVGDESLPLDAGHVVAAAWVIAFVDAQHEHDLLTVTFRNA